MCLKIAIFASSTGDFMEKVVYLDNGATTKVADEVLKEMNKFCEVEYGNASSLHSKGRIARDAVEKARQTIASAINALPREIIFTSGGSESDNLAIKGLAYAYLDKGNHLITSKIEHHAVQHSFKALEKEGFDVTYLDVDKHGFVDLKQLETAITPKTTLVSIIHANNEIGTIQDLKKISDICHSKGALFHTDAVQSFTKTELDVKKMGVDLASFSAHKIHGPKGIGALYISTGIKLKKQIEGGSQEFEIRAGTENVPGIMGFAKAATLLTKNDLDRMKILRDRLIKGLLSITKDSWLNGHPEKRLVNNVNVSYRHIEGEGMLLHLDSAGVCVSTGSACSSKSLEPSHVIMALGMKPEEAHGSMRFTLSKYTTEEEIDYAIDKTREVVTMLREMSPLVED